MNRNNDAVCQSCGMPLSQDPRGGGTEANGHKSTQYCSYCYSDGKFTHPEMTVDQVEKTVRDKMRGEPDDDVDEAVQNVRNLRRWQETPANPR